eukprot:519373-Rhodomonas_salina.2
MLLRMPAMRYAATHAGVAQRSRAYCSVLGGVQLCRTARRHWTRRRRTRRWGFPMLLHQRYAVSGTDVGYAPTQALRSVRY